MKEKIYTIPINEAFEQACECPLCLIERRLEKEAVEYELGPAMMEPDHREESNKKGFCNKHFDMLFASPNKLPLALVLDTRLDEIGKILDKAEPKAAKRGLFSKTAEKPKLSGLTDSCMVCEKVEKTMERYYDVLLQLWRESEEFRGKMAASRGFCLPHFEGLYERSTSAEFSAALLEKERAELAALKADVHKFTLKFDYRNKDMEWGTAKNAPLRAVEKIGGYIRFSGEDNDGIH